MAAVLCSSETIPSFLSMFAEQLLFFLFEFSICSIAEQLSPPFLVVENKGLLPDLSCLPLLFNGRFLFGHVEPQPFHM